MIMIAFFNLVLPTLIQLSQAGGMDSRNFSNTNEPPLPKTNGRTFVVVLMIIILAVMALVVIRCMFECQRQRKHLQRNRTEVLKKQKFKEELETAVKNRRERLERQENESAEDGQRSASTLKADNRNNGNSNGVHGAALDDIIAV